MAACRLSGFKRSGKGPVHSPVCHEVITNQKQQQNQETNPHKQNSRIAYCEGTAWASGEGADCRFGACEESWRSHITAELWAVLTDHGMQVFFLLETAALRVLGPSSAWFRIVLASVSRASSSGVCFLVFGLDQRASAKRPILRSVHDQASCCEASSIVSVHHATL